MKILLLSIFTTITLGNTNYDLVNTVWKFEVSKNCNDTLEFLKNNRVLEYSCEKDYHFTGSYKINKNISDMLLYYLILCYRQGFGKGAKKYNKFNFRGI